MRESAAVYDPNNPHRELSVIAMAADAVDTLTEYTMRAATLLGIIYADSHDRAAYALMFQRGRTETNEVVRLPVEAIRHSPQARGGEWRHLIEKYDIVHRVPLHTPAEQTTLLRSLQARPDFSRKITEADTGDCPCLMALIDDLANAPSNLFWPAVSTAFAQSNIIANDFTITALR